MNKSGGPAILAALVILLVLVGIVLYRSHARKAGGPAGLSESSDAAGRPTSKGADPGKERLVSIVLLLDRPRALDEKTLGALATKAFGVQFGGKDDARFVVGESPMFLLKMDDLFLGIHNRAEPYVPDPAKEAEKISDLAYRDAFLRHKAWLAVDLMQVGQDRPPDTAYPYIARLIGALADDSALVVYCPDSTRMRLLAGEFKAKLVGPNPMAAIGEVIPDPLITVEDDDPEMKAAAEEARRRWPEFVAAFRGPDGGKAFSVKVPLKEGEHTEFIWVEVSQIKDALIDGRLGNDPVYLKKVKLGSRVQVKVADVTDWLYLKGGEIQGGFQANVLQKRKGG